MKRCIGRGITLNARTLSEVIVAPARRPQSVRRSNSVTHVCCPNNSGRQSPVPPPRGRARTRFYRLAFRVGFAPHPRRDRWRRPRHDLLQPAQTNVILPRGGNASRRRPPNTAQPPPPPLPPWFIFQKQRSLCPGGFANSEIQLTSQYCCGAVVFARAKKESWLPLNERQFIILLTGRNRYKNKN